MSLQLEHLEVRAVPAASFFQVADAVAVVGDEADDRISIQNIGGIVFFDLDYDGTPDAKSPLASFRTLTVSGGDGDDVIALQPGLGIDGTVLGGRGRDVISSFGSDTLIGGEDDDDFYSIVRAPIVFGEGGKDYFRVNVNAFTDASDEDFTSVIFGQAQADPVQLIDRVVYIQGTPNADRFFVANVRGRLTGNYNGFQFSFDSRDVDAFAGVLGAGNDVAAAAASVSQDVVLYGADGDDALSTGSGRRNLVKGGGGNDTLVGRGDFSGDAGADFIQIFVGGGNGSGVGGIKSRVRLDAFDLYFGPAGVQVLGRKA